MKQMQLPEGMKEKIDLSDLNLPHAAGFNNHWYLKMGIVSVVFGPDPQEGVFGGGKTANEALNHWNMSLKERLEQGGESDELADYIRKML